MATLYTIGNINLKTVEAVAKAVVEQFPDKIIEKIVILNSLESEKVLNEQIQLYRKYINNKFQVNNILLEEGDILKAEKIQQDFSTSDEKIVDITNGQRTISCMLYMIASLCNVEQIFYLKLDPKSNELSETFEKGVDYKYMNIAKLNDINSWGNISYFDLIYYIDEVNSIFEQDKVMLMPEQQILVKIYKGMISGIYNFFSNYDTRSAINNMVIGNERMIEALYTYIKENEKIKDFIERNKIKIDEQKSKLGAILYFYKKYNEQFKKLDISEKDENLLKLSTIPILSSALKEYRNFSSHYSINEVVFTKQEVRAVINMTIEVYKICKSNSEFWDFFINYKK